ncbi:hypothetical protein [Streptomyces sp. NPDC054888]
MIVGMLLARRQTCIQEALADLELTEKVAVLNFSVPRLRETSEPGLTHRSLYDCRAGLALVPLARDVMQEEYLRTVVRVLQTLGETLGSSLRSHVHWTGEDWEDLARATQGLHETATRNAKSSAIMADYWSREIDERTRELLRASDGTVPFEVFRTHFTQGADRIRTTLAWDVLAEMATNGSGAVRLEMVSTNVSSYDLSPLEGYFAPWYHDGSGEVGYDHQDAVPIRHIELATDLSRLYETRRSGVTALRNHYGSRVDGQRISLVLATYSLGEGRHLVLDGNHRLTALAQLVAQGCPVRVTEYRLTAPLEPSILPDLAHHQPE